MNMNNQIKYDTYAKLSVDLRKALHSGFYFQAVFIEYAMFEDRLTSLLKHAGIPYKQKNGYDNRCQDCDYIQLRSAGDSDMNRPQQIQHVHRILYGCAETQDRQCTDRPEGDDNIGL